jgi:Tol biopolymer transport system component/DNA-binding winged helix-turn-helix (wHTH) protein
MSPGGNDFQMTPIQSNRARFGPFEVDLHTRELWKFGTRIKLVGQPFEILAVLLGKAGELVTREELHTRLWPADTFVDFNHGLNAAVNKLREALSDSADSPRYVETLPRRGYRFVAQVEWVQDQERVSLPVVAPSASISAEVKSEVPAASVFEPRAEAGKPGFLRWKPLLVGASAILVLIVGAMFLPKAIARFRLESTISNASPQRTRPLNPLDAMEPSFSPDGNSIAFVRDGKNGARGIYTAAVGSDQFVQLTHHDGDCCPSWSPDGRLLAYTRYENNSYTIHIVSADGGAELKRIAEKTLAPTSAAYSPVANSNDRQLDTNGVIPQHGELDWFPDGKSIAFAATGGIYRLTLRDSSVVRLTHSPPLAQDWGPVFSPDGDRVLFVRTRDVGSPDEIWVTPAAGGDAARVLSERGRVVSTPQWSSDGRSVIYASNRSGHPALWRASLDTPDSIVQIGEAGSPAWDPAVSRRGYRMAYERVMRSLSIWQMDLSPAADKRPSILISSTSDTDQGPAPQFSPDGKKLAYMSDRSGTMEIWISNRDGSNAFQLTAVGGAGTPRWSPDSESIVFDANATNGSKIVAINVRGGAPRILTQDSFHSVCPSWSRDGQWIYFASPRGGNWQVWKVAAAGGTPAQVTRQGGHAALESADGKFLYYAKSETAEPEIWQVPVEGGAETPLPLVRPGTWASWQVVEGGILFVGPSLGHQAVLSSFDLASHRTTSIAVLDRIPFWLGATLDGRTVAFDQPGQEQAQAMLVENFR